MSGHGMMPRKIVSSSSGGHIIAADSATAPEFPIPLSVLLKRFLSITARNNGSILMQYKDVANIDNNNNYATVGIEDSYHERGLGLTYARNYLASVDTLAPGRGNSFYDHSSGRLPRNGQSEWI